MLLQFYKKLISWMDDGRFDEVAASLREFREAEVTPQAQEAIRRLISARIAIFKGQAPQSVDWLKMRDDEHPWIEAESLAILGVHCFHQKKDLEGADLFEKARQKFEAIGFLDREIMSAYNAFIGRMNGGAIPELVDQLHSLKPIERKIRAADLKDPKLQSLLAAVLRQKSYLFQKSERINAALSAVEEAIPLYELHGPQSDYHLSLLQGADLCIDLGDPQRARQFLERIVPPLETRVEFPLALIRWRLGGDRPDPSRYEFVSPFWKEKWETLSAGKKLAEASEGAPILRWDLKASILTDSSTRKEWKLRSASIEGRLIRILCRGRASKHLLIESLWPEQAKADLLDDRFHRLISRVNKKLGGLIIFDGHSYDLRQGVEIV